MVPSAAKGISAKDCVTCSWIAGKVRRSKAKFDGPMDSFPIVGIGASAGGIEALKGFFRGLPADPGFAVVIVTHLSPERESLLHEL